MVEHEPDNLEDLISHHVLTDLEYILDTVGLNQVDLNELFDGNKSVRHLDSRLADGVIEARRINKLLFDERREIVPHTCLLRDLNWLKRLSVHMEMQQNSHEESSHFVRELLVLDQALHCVK